MEYMLLICVRVREGKPLVTDGPFAETREHLGGYVLMVGGDFEKGLARMKSVVEAAPTIRRPEASCPGGDRS